MRNLIILTLILIQIMFAYSQENLHLEDNKDERNINMVIIGQTTINHPIIFYCVKNRLKCFYKWKELYSIVMDKDSLQSIYNKFDVGNLIFYNGYYELADSYFICKYVIPNCNVQDSLLIRNIYACDTVDAMLSLQSFVDDSKKNIFSKNCFYTNIKTTKFLLVLVNYSWYRSTLPMYEYEYKESSYFYRYKCYNGLYVKLIIPLKK